MHVRTSAARCRGPHVGLQTSRVRTPAVPRSALAPADLASAHACSAEVRTCLQTSPPTPADLCGAAPRPSLPYRPRHLRPLSGSTLCRRLHGPPCGRLHVGAHVCTKLRMSVARDADVASARSEALYCPRSWGGRDVCTPDGGATRLRAARGPLSGPGQSGPLHPGPRHSGRAHPPAVCSPDVRTGPHLCRHPDAGHVHSGGSDA